ncbi:MAG: stage II sporulation protein R [Bacillota bacterium]
MTEGQGAGAPTTMKARLFGCVALAILGCVAAAASAAADAPAPPAAPGEPARTQESSLPDALWGSSPAIVRLHVIAHSDRQEDQRVKLRVARAVLLELKRLYEEAPAWAHEDPDRFLSYLGHNRDRLARAARATPEGRLAALLPASVRVETGLTYFPVTAGPEGQIYPAGWYRTVRVIIGSGRGRNWWCVVFPSLCPVEPPDEADLPSAHAAPAQAGGAAAGPGTGPAAPPASNGKAGPRPWWAWLLPWHWF